MVRLLLLNSANPEPCSKDCPRRTTSQSRIKVSCTTCSYTQRRRTITVLCLDDRTKCQVRWDAVEPQGAVQHSIKSGNDLGRTIKAYYRHYLLCIQFDSSKFLRPIVGSLTLPVRKTFGASVVLWRVLPAQSGSRKAMSAFCFHPAPSSQNALLRPPSLVSDQLTTTKLSHNQLKRSHRSLRVATGAFRARSDASRYRYRLSTDMAASQVCRKCIVLPNIDCQTNLD